MMDGVVAALLGTDRIGATGIAGLCALGWRWAQAVDLRPGGLGDRVVTWGSDISGGLFFAHVLVLQLLLIGLDHTALRADGGWGSVALVLFVGTVAATAAMVTIARRTPLRLVLTGPDRTAQRAWLRWWPSRVVVLAPVAVAETAIASG